MNTALIVQVLFVCAFAIAAWWATERFAPDPLLEKLVKLVIFVAVVIFVVAKLIPAVF